MRSDEEFLIGMWRKFEILENNQMEEERVLQINKAVNSKQLLIYIAYISILLLIKIVFHAVAISAAPLILIFSFLIITAIKLEFSMMKPSMKAD